LLERRRPILHVFGKELADRVIELEHQLIALAIMGTPFGFMAFLGIASLIGVIVSHVIVLFDFIEEMHEKGEALQRAR
jgi:multidrug efflux pump subunit AcrB